MSKSGTGTGGHSLREPPATSGGPRAGGRYPSPLVLPGLPTPILASLTDPLVNAAVDVVNAMGLPGVFLLKTLESACNPIPSEATMLFAGFNVSEGDMTLLGITAAGVLGNLLGSWIAYAIGYFGRLELLERHKVLHVNPKHLAAADRLPRPVTYLTFDPAQIPVALSLGFSLPEDDLTRP